MRNAEVEQPPAHRARAALLPSRRTTGVTGVPAQRTGSSESRGAFALGKHTMGVHARFVLKRRKSRVLEEQGTRGRSRCTETRKPARGIEFKGLPGASADTGQGPRHQPQHALSDLDSSSLSTMQLVKGAQR